MVSMSLHPLLTGPRIESYRVELLDRNDQSLGDIDGVSDGSVEQNADAIIRGGCQLTLDNADDIDWHTSRVRPWVVVNGLTWPLGVFLPTSPETSYSATRRSWSFKGVDKLSVLSGDAIPESYALPAGSVITTAAQDIIESAGETSVVVTPSGAELVDQLVWTPGTTKLRMVNDLLQSINYSSVWVDRFGRYRMEPYVAPSSRPDAAVFQRGQTAIHTPDVGRTQDIAGVPNRVVMTTSGSDDTPSLRAVAENHDPSSPYSYEARGDRWVTKTHEGAEAPSQASLDLQAERSLWASSNPPAYLTVDHAIVPLEPNEVVRFNHLDIDTRASVNEYSISLIPGSMMSGKWREL